MQTIHFYFEKNMNNFFSKVILLGLLAFLNSCGGSKIPNFYDDEEEKEVVKEEPESKTEVKTVKTQTAPQILPIQRKYASILGIAPNEAKSIALYNFIDSWEGTTYLMGGENRRGIDCSFFSQFLYHDVYNTLIERTADKQFLSPSTDKFIGQEYLEEGDLLFFNLSGSQYETISHVGVYIGNGMFVHSTSRKAKNGRNGVQISYLNDDHWQRLFVSAGRKSINQ